MGRNFETMRKELDTDLNSVFQSARVLVTPTAAMADKMTMATCLRKLHCTGKTDAELVTSAVTMLTSHGRSFQAQELRGMMK